MNIIIRLLLLTASLHCVRSFSPYCPDECSKDECGGENLTCPGGVTLDACRCCEVCSKVQGESCGGYFGSEGTCDIGLTCVTLDKRSNVGQCQRVDTLCKKKICGFRQQCSINKHGRAVCVCPRNCKESKGRPVCGYKNGRQYKNSCDLYRHECRSGKEIGFISGPCKKCFHHGQPFKFGDTRRGPATCEKCVCHHGEWICKTKKHCQDRLDFCTVFKDRAGVLSSTCPPGYWCRVQIPSIPEQNIPGVGRCVSAASSATANISTSPSPTRNVSTTTVTEPKTDTILANVCELPSKTGPCRAAITRWYFNKSRRKCMKFTFGGCDGNANSFPTKSKCRHVCMRRRAKTTSRPTTTRKPRAPKTTEKSRNMTEVCQLPPAPGPCRAAMPQWYHNPKRQRCSRFIYGGCGGNDNNFDSKDECKAACMRNKGTMPTEPPTTLSSESKKVLNQSRDSPSANPSTYPTTATQGRSTTTTARPPSAVFSCPCSECPLVTGETTCETKYGCYTTQFQRTDGSQTIKYGCIDDEKQYSIVCNVRSPDEHQTQMSLECCKGHMCSLNDGLLGRESVGARTDLQNTQEEAATVATPSQATVIKETVFAETPRCFDAHSRKFYRETEEWKPNDCTVCTCRGGRLECLATVCRHPNCADPLRVKGQCCPVCTLHRNTSEDSQDMIKALAESQLTTVLVSIMKDKDKRFCEDANSGELYPVGQNWNVDDCTTCYCQRDGKIACAVQMCNGYPGCPNPVKEKGHCCPVCKEEQVEEDLLSPENEVINSPHSCLDPVTGDHYRRAEMWQQDDCTACICGAGRKHQCRKTACKTLTCANKIHLKGRCCPACAEASKTGCIFEGQEYLPGEYKLLADHCTLCECRNSEWNCSKRRCRKNHARGL